jgi:hypothetical protein
MSSVSDQLIGSITPRRWAAFVRNAFGPLALLADVFTIVAVAGITGAIYHKLIYGAADESLCPTSSAANTRCRTISRSGRTCAARSISGT